MDVIVLRNESNPHDGTEGVLTTEKGFTCDTLELPWHNNKRGVSCIFADVYDAQLWLSPTFGRTVVRLADKHGRQNCLVHNGNFAGDPLEGEFTQVHGCTLVGTGYGMIEKPDGGLQRGILASKLTLAALIKHLGNGRHRFTYAWAAGAEPEDLTDLNN